MTPTLQKDEAWEPGVNVVTVRIQGHRGSGVSRMPAVGAEGARLRSEAAERDAAPGSRCHDATAAQALHDRQALAYRYASCYPHRLEGVDHIQGTSREGRCEEGLTRRDAEESLGLGLGLGLEP